MHEERMELKEIDCSRHYKTTTMKNRREIEMNILKMK